MAATNGDLLRLVDTQEYLGETCLNVYYYRVEAALGLADPYLETLNEYWMLNVMPTIQELQISSVHHLFREWRNLSNGLDLFVDSEVVNGAVSESSSAPSFTSLGFMLVRDSLVTRNGYKRFTGIPESFIDGNLYVGDADIIEDVETSLAGGLNVGLIAVAFPVIVKRPIDVPAGSYDYSGVNSCTFRGLGTQNTRKPGRGI